MVQKVILISFIERLL